MTGKFALILALAAVAAAQDAPAADPTTINLKPVLRPAFRRNANGEYEVPATAPADYGAALASALAKWAGVKADAVAVTPGKPVVASKPGGKVVEGDVTCAGPNVCMPFNADIKAASEKAATKLRDTLKDGKLASLSNELKSATGGLKTADGVALPAARGFSLGSVDGKASSRSLDLASLSSASKKGLSKGAIAGIVVGSILGALLLAGLLWALCCRGASGAGAAAGGAGSTGNAATDAKLGAATGATGGGARGGTTTTTATTAATDAKLGKAASGRGGAAAAGTTTTATTTTVADEKPQSGLAKLASTLSGKNRGSKTAEAVDAVERAADKVVDAANRV